ncbi:hypothetical protein JMA02_06870, partial [Acinetobacter baumannii]|nr:hypothetical protein [Acinetobacter baumannii]
SKLASLASVPAMSVFLALIALIVMAGYVDDHQRLAVTMAGIWAMLIRILLRLCKQQQKMA